MNATAGYYGQFNTSAKTDGLIWGLAIALSLMVHMALLINRTTELSTALKDSDSERIITRVSLRMAAPTPEKPVELKPEPPKPQPPKPEPVQEKPKPKPKPTPKPVEKRPPPEKIKREEVQPTPAQPTPIVEELPEKTLQISRAEIAPHIVEQAKQSYLAKLLAHIESHKHYPKAARRRRIEGEVQVSFILQDRGLIDGLEVVGTKKVLQKATRSAVLAALPMPGSPKELELPLPINFTMAFVLR